MATIPTNPFTNRSTIRNEHDFVGREQEITNILSRVRNGDSVSVVGDRRIGKSSLLYHLFLTGNRRLDDAAKTKFKFIYLDLQEPHFANQAEFCKTLIKELNGAPITTEAKADDLELLSHLSDTLSELKSQQRLPVLLMDEFKKLVAKPAQKDDPPRYTDDCFNALRAFANAHSLCLVTSSQRTLRELTEQEGLTSPLWNIFMVQPLGEFIVSDMVDEVALFLTLFWSGELQPTPEEQAFLISYCSRHPLVMQVVSYWVRQNRILGLNEMALKQEIERELSSYFRGKNELIARWLKKKVPPVFKKMIWTAQEISKVIKPELKLSIVKDI